MAKSRKSKAEEVEEEVEEELDEEDLDDLADDEEVEDEDEDLDEDEEDDDEEDEEDEAPRGRKKSKGQGRARKARDDGRVGSFEVAEALGTDGRNLRVMIRDRGLNAKSFESGRYEWDSVDDALKQMKIKGKSPSARIEAAKEALADSRNTRLQALKDRNAENRASESTETKSSSGKKKTGKRRK